MKRSERIRRKALEKGLAGGAMLAGAILLGIGAEIARLYQNPTLLAVSAAGAFTLVILGCGYIGDMLAGMRAARREWARETKLPTLKL
jgi:hypothetical protein